MLAVPRVADAATVQSQQGVQQDGAGPGLARDKAAERWAAPTSPVCSEEYVPTSTQLTVEPALAGPGTPLAEKDVNSNQLPRSLKHSLVADSAKAARGSAVLPTAASAMQVVVSSSQRRRLQNQNCRVRGCRKMMLLLACVLTEQQSLPAREAKLSMLTELCVLLKLGCMPCRLSWNASISIFSCSHVCSSRSS